MIEESMVVYVRGTPASGKTTLAHLLHKYYLGRGIPSVAIPVWPKPSEPGDPNSYLSTLVAACHGEGYTHIEDRQFTNRISFSYSMKAKCRTGMRVSGSDS